MSPVAATASNRELAEKYLTRFRLGMVLEADVVALEALLDMATERGMAMAAWDSEEPTVEVVGQLQGGV